MVLRKMSNSFPAFLVLFVFGCSSLPKEKQYDFFTVDTSNKQPFPEISNTPIISGLKFKNTSLISSVNSLQNAQTKIISIASWSEEGNQLVVNQELQTVEKTIISNNQTTSIDGSKIFRGQAIQIKVDCATSKIISVVGDQQVKGKIKTGTKSKVESDALLEIFSNLIESTRMSCKRTTLGPFTLVNVSGKLPLYTWNEPVPVPGFENEILKATFLGWQVKEGKTFAVLEGIATGKKLIPQANNMEQSFEMAAWAFISPDRSTTRRLAKTKISVKAGQEMKVLGDLTIDVLSERLNESH